jgi:SAM-dependent methyltransferase
LGIRDALPRRPEFLDVAGETGVEALLASERQIAQFEKIHHDYVAHYYDTWSMRYREEFIFPFISNGQDLNGKRVAELACGSGYNSLALRERFPRVRLTGFDISPPACADYARNLGAPATQVDLTRPIDVAERFDLAFVIGGLHHCVSDLDQTLANVAKILTPGGFFVMLEPNAQFFLEAIRKLWYRLDGSFDAATEHALNHDQLLKSAERYFHCADVKYFGGPAYFGVLNSMILRIPLGAKPVLSPPLIAMERLWNRIPGRRMHNVFLGRWQRNDRPVDG